MRLLSQHSFTGISLRVIVLGLLFYGLVLTVCGWLWLRWGYAWWLYAIVAAWVLSAGAYLLWRQQHALILQNLDPSLAFLLSSNSPIVVTHVWYSPVVVRFQYRYRTFPQKTHYFTLWRSAVTPEIWRQAHIHLRYYQLLNQQASLADPI